MNKTLKIYQKLQVSLKSQKSFILAWSSILKIWTLLPLSKIVYIKKHINNIIQATWKILLLDKIIVSFQCKLSKLVNTKAFNVYYKKFNIKSYYFVKKCKDYFAILRAIDLN